MHKQDTTKFWNEKKSDGTIYDKNEIMRIGVPLKDCSAVNLIRTIYIAIKVNWKLKFYHRKLVHI